MTIINNEGKFIIYNSAKTSFILVRNINSMYNEKYRNYEPVTNIITHQKLNDVLNSKIIYDIYVVIRNPYSRIVSSFYAISNSPIYLSFNKLYNNFESFINLIYDIYKDSINNQISFSETDKIKLSIKKFINKNDDEIGTLDREILWHVFHQYFQINECLNYDIKKLNIYETSKLNSFIIDFNKKYNLNYPIGKTHAFDYSSDSIINDVSKLSLDDIYKLKPPVHCFLKNNEINEKIKEIFSLDFELGNKLGYNFTIDNYL